MKRKRPFSVYCGQIRKVSPTVWEGFLTFLLVCLIVIFGFGIIANDRPKAPE